jgi:DNA invertase Pin-like site-specific DNA recombinase
MSLVEDVFTRRGIEFISLAEKIDTTSAMGRFFLQMMGSLAELERGLIGERTAAALAHKIETGAVLGAAPLGQRKTVGSDGKLTARAADETEVATVARVLELHRARKSTRAIAAILIAEGHATKRGGRWASATVANIIRREAK